MVKQITDRHRRENCVSAKCGIRGTNAETGRCGRKPSPFALAKATHGIQTGFQVDTANKAFKPEQKSEKTSSPVAIRIEEVVSLRRSSKGFTRSPRAHIIFAERFTKNLALKLSYSPVSNKFFTLQSSLLGASSQIPTHALEL
jgi:hypothetical protein